MKYQKIVQDLDRIFYLIGKQGISYQETQKAIANSDILWNPGNILAIIRHVKHLYLLLYEHIRTTLQKDIFYMIPTSQNEFIGTVAKWTIQIWLKSKMPLYFCRRSYSCHA